MREIEFLSPESPIVVKELRPFPERGEVGQRAYDYLHGRVSRRELVARSFELYKVVLDQFTMKAKRVAEDRPNAVEVCTPAEAFQSECIAEFLAEATSPFNQRLRRQVLRHFASFCRIRVLPESLVLPLERVMWNGKPVLCRPVTAAPPASEASDADDIEHDNAPVAAPPFISARIPSAAEVAALEVEVGHILSMTASERGTHTANDYMVMRAAAVAFCRFGGAVVADLVGMKMADVLTSVLGDAPESVGVFWRARRPRRQPGLSGPAKFAEVEIEYEPRAIAPIAAWIATRQMDGATPDDAVFIRPETKAPLNRRLVWRLVAGLPLKETKRKDDKITASRAERARTKNKNERTLISPSRLRHVQGIKLVEQYESGDALTAALRRHMGVSGRGIAWIYARDGAARGLAAQACVDAAVATDISEIAPPPQ